MSDGRDPVRARAKRDADALGCFWLPCSRCGEWLGGHEDLGNEHVRFRVDNGVFHGACCPSKGEVEDDAACRRNLEMHGDERCFLHPDCVAYFALGYACAADAARRR